MQSNGKSKIPAPRTGNWQISFGGWKGFTEEIHRSIGKKLGSGTLHIPRQKKEKAGRIA